MQQAFLGTILALNLVQVSVFCLTADEIEAERSGWNSDPNTQYHIQTDEGPERYFRFQTLNGQYRKEKRLADGTVIGTEGWLDPLGFLRIKDYIADRQGYRILKSKMVFVGKDRPVDDAVAISKNVPAQSGILTRPRRPPNPFRQGEIKDISSNSIEVNTVSPLRSFPSTIVSVSPSPLPSSSPSPSSVSIDYNSLIAPTTLRPRPFSIVTPSAFVNRHNDDEDDDYLQSNLNYLSSGYGFRNNYVPPAYQARLPYGLSRPALIAYNKRQTQGRKTRRANANSRGSLARRQAPSQNYDAPEYDGHHSTADGFQYYLKTHYHEEQRQPDDGNVGSFGYIDPFGIRRVIYYKTDANGGFVHKKNNRYVGFNAPPYDPAPDPRRVGRKN